MKKQIWKRLRKQDLPQTIFFIIMIVSAGLVVLPLWNYTKYYLALSDFNYTLTKITLYTSHLFPPTSGIAKINITLTASNPTDYSGLQIGTAWCDLEYYGDYHEVALPPASLGQQPTFVNTNVWDLGSVSSPPTQSHPIGPHTNTEILIETSINGSSGTGALAFISYLESLSTESAPQVDWSISCTLSLQTFQGSVARTGSFSPVTLWNPSTT